MPEQEPTPKNTNITTAIANKNTVKRTVNASTDDNSRVKISSIKKGSFKIKIPPKKSPKIMIDNNEENNLIADRVMSKK